MRGGVVTRALALSIAGWIVSPALAITLSATCPPSFEHGTNGCQLRSPYRQYASLRNAGVGGLKTGLPPMREGFSAQQVDLGRLLFFDPILSANKAMACSSCHDPAHGFADGRPQSDGADGHPLRRNAPSLWNVAFLQRFFWDGRATSLEAQMQGPLYDPREMGNTPARLLGDLNASAEYRRLFGAAFADAGPAIRADHVYRAIAAFESTLVSLASRYDLYAHGYDQALTPDELRGLNVFRSFVARCAECHTPPLFTNQQLAVIGAPEARGMPFDPGAGALPGLAEQRGAFKVPSLRNIAVTAPYGHNGAFVQLKDAVRFYTLGRGHAVPRGERLVLHWHIWEPRLSEAEIDQLVAFLGALTDQSFMPAVPVAVPSGLPVGGRKNFSRGD